MPLKSDLYPEGIPGLKGTDEIKVEKAHVLYEFTRQVLNECIRRNIPCIIENPENSLTFATKFFQDLPAGLRWAVSHSCMYGFAHRKATGLLSTIPLPRVQMMCSGNHRHAKWGLTQQRKSWQFKTAVAEYTAQFCSCEVAARDIMEACQMQGLSPLEEVDSITMASMAGGSQPRKPFRQISPSHPSSAHLPPYVCLQGLPFQQSSMRPLHIRSRACQSDPN